MHRDRSRAPPDAWIHVDGAFGLWAAAAPSMRHLVAVTTALTPGRRTGTNGSTSRSTPGLIFVAGPCLASRLDGVTESYLFFDEEHHRDPGDYVPELSRRARGFPGLRRAAIAGPDGVVDLVERCCRYARRFADELSRDPGVGSSRRRAQPGPRSVRRFGRADEGRHRARAGRRGRVVRRRLVAGCAGSCASP